MVGWSSNDFGVVRADEAGEEPSGRSASVSPNGGEDGGSRASGAELLIESSYTPSILKIALSILLNSAFFPKGKHAVNR
jgi:hypothetical protein